MLDSEKLRAEWLEADGLGGFASGTVGGERTRRYHALLLTATTPPTGRMALVSGMEVFVKTPRGIAALSTQRYLPNTRYPNGETRIASFSLEPWPTWRFRLEEGLEIEQTICAIHGSSVVTIGWRLVGGVAPTTGPVTLSARPLLSVRDYHGLHRENAVFRFVPKIDNETIIWRPYDHAPAIGLLTNGRYRHDPVWYRNFLYTRERERGLDCVEDLGSPGVVEFDLSQQDAVWALWAEGKNALVHSAGPNAESVFTSLRDQEQRRRARFASPLDRAADAYLVDRGAGRTIVAGYPWFTDWGRDTFISMRGLCLATGRLDEAQSILLAWSGMVDQGMLPNRFPDAGSAPEYNSVDASLWFVIVAHEFLELAAQRSFPVAPQTRQALEKAILAIISGYAQGTRFGIHADADGLLACGVPGVQLTWMDAKVGDWVVTPRIGKPVEVEALWLAALDVAGHLDQRWQKMATQGRESFLECFLNPEHDALFDVVDVDHRPGQRDDNFRPNQIFAIGGLPRQLVEGELARRIVDAVEDRLWTPLGLRTLAPGSLGYRSHYEGGITARDGAYHQGTAWPWLLGPFVEAWLRVRGGSVEAKREARARFIEPVLEHLKVAGLGHISEIVDGAPPHAPRGCPWQAWSLGELLRLTRSVLAEEPAASGGKKA